MDLAALLVFIGGFAVCAGVVFLISFLGAKEQTYEEALKEQKERNKDVKKPSKTKNNDKKKKWKKSKGDGQEKNDTEQDVEEDVVLVESVKEEEPLVVEESREEPSPLPTPEAKKPKLKKKKIIIEDVDEVLEQTPVTAPEPVKEPVASPPEPIIEEPVPVVETTTEPIPQKATPTKSKSKKQKQDNGNVNQSALPSNPRDLLTTIKRTAFNDEEAQAVINVLLTKQSGGPLNTSEEWIEQGKPSESQRLKQELSETTKCLEEERNNRAVFEKQLTATKRDMNDKLVSAKKGLVAEHQRLMNEMAANHTMQMNQLKGRMTDIHNNEHALRSRIGELELQKLHTESQYQAQVDNLSHQLQMNQNVPAPTFNDPALLSELEQLRSLRDRYEGQLKEFLSENKGLKEQVGGIEGLRKQLEGAKDEVSRVSSSSSSLSSALTSAQSEATHLGLAKAKLEAELARVISQLEESKKAAPEAATQSELASVRSKLAEKEAETVKLGEENERLSEQLASSVERPAADGEESEKANGHSEIEVAAPQITKEKTLISQGEEWREKFEHLHLDNEKMLAKQKVAQAEFNDKLTSIEQALQTANSKNNELASQLSVAKNSSSVLMARLFPNIDNCTEEKAVSYLSSIHDNTGELDRLEGQVEHYKTVLAQTENMLNSLQSSVESAESEWRLKLESANKELIEIRSHSSSLNAKVEALERELSQVDNTEMQNQLAALQAQVLAQETEKKDLENINEELKAKAEEMTTQLNELSVRHEELAKGNTGLQAALGVAQEAVEKERGGIRALQEQLNGGKEDILGNGNGCDNEIVQ